MILFLILSSLAFCENRYLGMLLCKSYTNCRVLAVYILFVTVDVNRVVQQEQEASAPTHSAPYASPLDAFGYMCSLSPIAHAS
jgi:hypothetical protein